MPAGNMWDLSNILMGNQSGQYRAAGIQTAAQNISRGIMEYRQQQQEKEAAEAAKRWLKTNATAYGLQVNVADEKELGAVIKAAGGGPQAISLISQLTQQKQQANVMAQEAELRKAQLQQIQAQQQQQQANAGAMTVAAGGSPGAAQLAAMLKNGRVGFRDLQSTGNFATDYLRAGGELTPQVVELARMLSKGQQAPASYQTIDVPGAGKMVVDAATGAPVDAAKIIKPSMSSDAGPQISSDGKYQRSGPNDEWKPIPEKKNDAKALTSQELQRIESLNQTERDLNMLEQAYKEVGADWGGPVAGRIKGMDPTDPNVSRIDSLVTGATPNLARGVFHEVGVLTDRDVDRYKALLPSRTDTEAQRKQKFADLRTRLKSARAETIATLKAAGRDVDGLENMFQAGSADGGQSPDVQSAGAIPTFSSEDEINAALERGTIKRGSYVRVFGQLYKVQ